jgi:hypothetical protein
LLPGEAEIHIVDSQSGKIHPVLSVAPNTISLASISADNRWIYFSLGATEADIWLANL